MFEKSHSVAEPAPVLYRVSTLVVSSRRQFPNSCFSCHRDWRGDVWAAYARTSLRRDSLDWCCLKSLTLYLRTFSIVSGWLMDFSLLFPNNLLPSRSPYIECLRAHKYFIKKKVRLRHNKWGNVSTWARYLNNTTNNSDESFLSNRRHSHPTG